MLLLARHSKRPSPLIHLTLRSPLCPFAPATPPRPPSTTASPQGGGRCGSFNSNLALRMRPLPRPRPPRPSRPPHHTPSPAQHAHARHHRLAPGEALQLLGEQPGLEDLQEHEERPVRPVVRPPLERGSQGGEEEPLGGWRSRRPRWRWRRRRRRRLGFVGLRWRKVPWSNY